ncbi:MAG: alpha-galactosidase, partial [Clostridiales bacterium]|nr:alpha-galactosidase [Clostridiales bacterium]
MARQAEVAAQLGFEVFVVDYGWSISAGDRRENRERFPSGIKKISEYVKSLGMKFGLWVAITSLDPGTAPTEDPLEWFALTEEGTVHDEENIAGKCACLASGYKNYFESELDRIITEYRVDWFKYDQNIFIECYAKGHEHQNNRDSLYYQVRSFYEVLDHILARHPGLIIESALSGAMILDYGILQRAHTTFLHDDLRTYFIRRFFHGVSYPLPPRYSAATSWALPSLNRDASAGDLNDRKDVVSRRCFYDYFYRASIMGACNISDDLLKLPSEAYESMKRVIELYKNVRCRIKGPIRHILPQPRDPREWDAAEVYDDKLCEGMVFIFRPSSPVPEINIKLTGLDNDKKYQIYSENHSKITTTLSGRELMESGLRIRINETSGSEILHFWVL